MRTLSPGRMTGPVWILLAGLVHAAEPAPLALPTLEIVDETYRATATKSALPSGLTP